MEQNATQGTNEEIFSSGSSDSESDSDSEEDNGEEEVNDPLLPENFILPLLYSFLQIKLLLTDIHKQHPLRNFLRQEET